VHFDKGEPFYDSLLKTISKGLRDDSLELESIEKKIATINQYLEG